MTNYFFRGCCAMSPRWRGLAGSILICIVSGQAARSADDDWSIDASRYVWMRKDGQRITGNARLERQLSADKQACLDLLRESGSIVPEKNGSSMARGCLAAKGYVLIPKEEIERRLAEAASANLKREAATEKSPPVAQSPKPDLSDPNKTNRIIRAMSEKDRREFFATIMLANSMQCGEVTRSFFRGSARPSYNASWAIGCSNGPNYAILIMSDEKGSAKAMTCGELRAMGGGECFVKP